MRIYPYRSIYIVCTVFAVYNFQTGFSRQRFGQGLWGFCSGLGQFKVTES